MGRKKPATTPTFTTDDSRTVTLKSGCHTLTIRHALPPEGSTTLSMRRTPYPASIYDHGSSVSLDLDAATALAISDALREAVES